MTGTQALESDGDTVPVPLLESCFRLTPNGVVPSCVLTFVPSPLVAVPQLSWCTSFVCDDTHYNVVLMHYCWLQCDWHELHLPGCWRYKDAQV